VLNASALQFCISDDPQARARPEIDSSAKRSNDKVCAKILRLELEAGGEQHGGVVDAIVCAFLLVSCAHVAPEVAHIVIVALVSH
jgi:hypothetical protein